ncbi:MAG: efflux RND transporter periplasmic adaptor subunit [Pseudomonadota bacterium]|nr:efflux RND transporter periplasmic adaptor subunit [Pseudomonadota bacterium]
MQRTQTVEVDPEVAAVLGAATKRRSRAWLVGGALLAVVLAGVGAAAFRSGSAPLYETAEVTRGALVEKVTAVGRLEPMDSVEVGSDLSGKVEAVLVDVNESVTKGQPLARLDPTPFQNAVAQAKAQLASARASLAQAKVTDGAARLDAERTARLLERGAATAVDAEDARIAYDQAIAATAGAEAQVALRKAALTGAEDDLADTVITAPIDGVVTVRLVDPGQTVVSSMSATALFTVASDLKDLKAEVGVDEADVGKVAAAQPARFTVSAWPDRTFDATVTTVDLAPQDEDDVVTYDAELRLRNDDLALRPGLTVTAEIEVGRLDDVLLVPTTALRFEVEAGRDGDDVWVLDGETPRAVPVTVLGTDGLSTAIRGDGLDAGARVIVGREER